MNRNVVLLALSQALAMTVVSLMLSSAALVAVALSAAPGWATLPLALQSLATLLALPVMARLGARHGRRPVFVGAALAGAAGLCVAVAALRAGSFTAFALAGLGIGIFGAASQYYRFAAAEAVPPSQRSQAISLTLAGGVLAAFLGPWIARQTRDLFAPPFIASFAVLVGVALLAALVGLGLRLPLPASGGSAQARRPLREIARQGRFRLAVVGGALAYGVMGLLMNATPLAMRCASHDFAATATVIQWHLVAMFAPSFVTGALIRRFGAARVMFGGGALMLAGIATALGGDAFADFAIALALVGIAWNFLYVAATTLLTETCNEAERPAVQAFNDSAVFLSVTLATLGAGRLVDGLGWERVNLLAAVPVALLMAAIAAAGRKRPALAPAP